ncbi:hypothetical protein EsH8_VIII_000922 [Colletotrichum jinshuiense]
MTGYPGQRPYGGGPPAPRPGPGPGPGPGPAPRGPQQFDGYQQDGYGYDQYDDGGYGPDYGGQYQDPNYARGPPPNQGYPQQDYYGGGGPGPGGPGPNGPGRGGGRPPQMGRGGPIARPPTADGGRGAYPPRGGGPGGRGGFPNARGGGRPGLYERSANSDPAPNRPRPQDQNPLSPQGFGGAFPAFPGQGRKTDLDAENAILNQMAGMEISPQRPPGPPGPPNGRAPPRGYPDQRRGPDPGYGGPPRDDFAPPSRSMTMPVNDPSQRRAPPPRMDTYGGPIAPPRGGVPPRPSTAQGNRPPPQRMYPPNPMPPPQQQQQQQQQQQYPPQQGGYGGEYDEGYDGYRETRASFGDVYDAYYHSTRMSNQSTASYAQHDVPDFNAAPSNGPRGSFDQHMRPGIAEHTQPGAKRVPEMSRTKSQPDLRQSQQAVFEMAGDAPPMPPMNGGYQDGYQGPNGWDQPPQNQQMGHPGMAPGPPPNRSADSLPSHPAPIRPGHMPNSMVSIADKPAPVRNYSGAPGGPTPPAGPGGVPPPQQAIPSQQPGKPSAPEITTPVTQEELERLRQIVKSNPNDQESAMRLAKRLVEAADVLAPHLADPKLRTRARERYHIDASKILKKLSNAQNPDAMFFYADCLGRGLFGVEPDNKEAFTLYQSAAKLGHAAAAYRTAVCCEIGHEEGGGTRKDPLKAIQWYKRAATLGDTPAMYKVGMILLKGLLGQPKNPREAVGWLKRAAERADAENPHALHELGLLYESAAPNDAIIKDEPYAFQLFRQAADLGYKFSQYRLGCAFEYGLMGCPVDPRQSIMWYSRAAQQGEHQSELSLSGWYLTGSDNVLQQSDTEAYLWARKAATAGLAKAEYAMGYFTEVGIGVPANMEDAKRWYWRAAAQDFPKARERLEDLKRAGKNGPRQRERISRSKIGKQQEGECSVM